MIVNSQFRFSKRKKLNSSRAVLQIRIMINTRVMNEYYLNAPRTEQDYLDTRVADQISWFDKSSSKNKKWYISLKVTEIILSLFIPFMVGYIDTEKDGLIDLTMVIGALGVMIAVIAGILTLVKFQENWVEYRSVSESLQHEKFTFLARTGVYKVVENPFPLFVDRIEGIISNSNLKWVDTVSQKEPEGSTEEAD